MSNFAGAGRRGPRVRLAQQFEGGDAKLRGEGVQGVESEVPFAPFDSRNIGAVESEHLGETFLRQTTRGPKSAEICSESDVQRALLAHSTSVAGRYSLVHGLMSIVGAVLISISFLS